MTHHRPRTTRTSQGPRQPRREDRQTRYQGSQSCCTVPSMTRQVGAAAHAGGPASRCRGTLPHRVSVLWPAADAHDLATAPGGPRLSSATPGNLVEAVVVAHCLRPCSELQCRRCSRAACSCVVLIEAETWWWRWRVCLLRTLSANGSGAATCVRRLMSADTRRTKRCSYGSRVPQGIKRVYN